jgi:hypothetical protein
MSRLRGFRPAEFQPLEAALATVAEPFRYIPLHCL